MSRRFKTLKEDLKSLEDEDINSRPPRRRANSGRAFSIGIKSPNWLKYLLFCGFMGTFVVYAGVTYTNSDAPLNNSFNSVQTWLNQPNEELIAGMGDWMEEMGYTELTREDLIELRSQGVTATYTSRMRDLGYTDLTLDQLVNLRQNNVSSTFVAMMQELGYTLSIDELIELRRHNVTAHFTSNLHDREYSHITAEELIRLKDVGVQISDVSALTNENGTSPTIEELIRYRISNQ